MTTVYIAANRKRLMAELDAALQSVRSQTEGMVTTPLYGKDERGRDATVYFTDEDMNHPGVVDELIVDVQA